MSSGLEATGVAGIMRAWKLCAVVLALALWVAGAGVAHANRFGPPWQIHVTAGRAIVYERPDTSSPIVGPLEEGAITILMGEARGSDGTQWVSTIDGFVPAVDVAELDAAWVGEVSVESVSIYAKPDTKSGVRRTAHKGDLLMVTGVSAGLDGDRNIWWSTTEGYVYIRTLAQATSRWAQEWILPTGPEAPEGWWGVITTTSNVRAGATMDAPRVGIFAGGERVKVLGEERGQPVGGNDTWYRIDGGRYPGARVHSSLVRRIEQPGPTEISGAGRDYVAVNRSARTLTLVEDGRPVFTTLVAIGQAGADTPTGRYTTFGKFLADDMTSRSLPNASRSYDLPNVPFTQYYRAGGYAIHGTYWHDLFGTMQSQGCINLTWADAAYLFGKTAPRLPEEDDHVWSSAEAATPVVITR